jgi:hypothetical protein
MHMAEEEAVDVGSAEAAVESTPAPEVDSSPSPSEGSAPSAGTGEVWGAFRQLPQFQGSDDRAIASRLYEALQREQSATHALQQYQSIIPVASEYLQYKEPFQQWMQTRQQAPQQMPQQQKAEESPWWNPPKVRDAYKSYLVRDQNGREMISEDAPLDARHALAEYQAYKANFAQKFLEDPQAALGPMVEKVAVERAESIVQERLGRMQEEQFVSSLEQQNADWLYDQNGNASPEGLLAQKYIQDARSLGIQGAKARWEYATRMVERDLLLSNVQRSQQAQQYAAQAPRPVPQQAVNPANVAAQKNMEYLRSQAMRTASQRPAAGTDARVPTKPMTFAEKLASQLQEQGLT